MDIYKAQEVSLTDILKKIGVKAVRKNKDEIWYLSPLHKKKVACFLVNKKTNRWRDHRLEKEGDTLDFALAYLEYSGENFGLHDGLRWVKNMSGLEPGITPVPVPDYSHEDKNISIGKAKPITHRSLAIYLQSRGIPLAIAARHLKQIKVYNKADKTRWTAVGCKNETRGYELRSSNFKGCSRPKDITFIRGKIPKPDGVHVFKSIMDYLSVLARLRGKPLNDDAIILHSLYNMKKASAYIKNYGYRFGYTWMDNDESGRQATASWDEFFKTEDNLIHKPMNRLYAAHKDVNAWHISKIIFSEDD